MTSTEGPRCGAPAVGGPCILPEGHNMGRLDIPTNHRSTEGPTPETDALIGSFERGYKYPTREEVVKCVSDLERRLRDANAECAIRNNEVTGLQGQLATERTRADALAVELKGAEDAGVLLSGAVTAASQAAEAAEARAESLERENTRMQSEVRNAVDDRDIWQEKATAAERALEEAQRLTKWIVGRKGMTIDNTPDEVIAMFEKDMREQDERDAGRKK